MDFSEDELEVISLKAISGSLDSMVNYEMIELEGDSKPTVFFSSAVHQRLFSVLFVDFLEKMDSNLTGIEKASAFEVLQEVCCDPKIGNKVSVAFLRESVDVFSKWLSKRIAVEAWFSSIEKEVNIQIKRMDFLKVCGNISKHGLARLTGASQIIVNVFKENEIQISKQDGLLIIDDFYERFHVDIFNYLGSRIVEMLNNIRWGIHEYLTPEFQRSYTRGDAGKIWYSYDVPKTIKNEFARSCYWGLMNDVRSKPIVEKFATPEIMKLRY